MVLYAHCEFLGGDGIHAAIAWRQESIIFGPRFTRTRGELADPPYQAADPPDMAINAGLRHSASKRRADATNLPPSASTSAGGPTTGPQGRTAANLPGPRR